MGVGMADNRKLIVYALEYCPNCETLKEYLEAHSIAFIARDLASAESMTELRVNGVFVNEAPVLQSGSDFLISRDLFRAGVLNEDRVRKLIEGL
jgi:glutaredoxin